MTCSMPYTSNNTSQSQNAIYNLTSSASTLNTSNTLTDLDFMDAFKYQVKMPCYPWMEENVYDEKWSKVHGTTKTSPNSHVIQDDL